MFITLFSTWGLLAVGIFVPHKAKHDTHTHTHLSTSMQANIKSVKPNPFAELSVFSRVCASLKSLVTMAQLILME